MKNKFLILLVFLSILLSSNKSIASDFNIEVKADMGIGLIYDMQKFGNSMAIVGTEKVGNDNNGIVRIFDGNKWDELPKFVNNDTNKHLVVDSYSRCAFDSKGNIWIGGKFSFYCYKNNIWNEYFYDDEFNKIRKYSNLYVDKSDNVWIQTSIYSNQNNVINSRSEFMKFDGKKFEIKYQTKNPLAFNYDNNSKNIAELSDGSIVTQVRINDGWDDVDFEKFLTKELFIFRPSGKIDHIFIPVFDSGKGAGNKDIIQIYADPDDKVWIPMNFILYYTLGYYCCSGLNVLENDKWRVLDTNNNLKLNVHLESFKKILKLNNGKYFVQSPQYFYTIGNDYMLHEIPWDIIKSNMSFTPSQKSKSIEQIKSNFKYDSTNGSFNFQNSRMIEYKPGELWLCSQLGILVLKSPVFSSVEDKIETTNSLFPNPANEFVVIENAEINQNYSISNLLGIEIGKGIIESGNRINIKNLNSGVYLLKINNNLGKVFTFIKE
jgi:hypothetical protein